MRIQLSLVPASVLRRQELASRRRALLLIPLLAIVGAAVLYGLLVSEGRRAREAAREVESRLVPIRPVVSQVTQLQAEIAGLEQRRKTLVGGAGRGQLQLSDLLTEISQVIPQDAWLQTLALETNILTLEGRALRLRSVGQFAAGLEQSGWLEQVRMQNLQQVEVGPRTITQFQITARLKGTGP